MSEAYANRNSDFMKFTNDLLYDNKITWRNTKDFFDSDVGLNDQDTIENKLKVFGIPWYLYPELSGRDDIDNIFNHGGFIRGERKYKKNDSEYTNSGGTGSGKDNVSKLIKNRILDSTLTIRAVSRSDDPYGNIYRMINGLMQGVTSILTFLTSTQWNNREQIHADVEGKQITLYTDLITEETHNNVQYKITNTVSENKLKHFGEIISDMISSSKFFGPFHSYATEYGYKGLLENTGEGGRDFLGGLFSFHHWSKMLTRETINLWRAGRQLMNTNFEIILRASSNQTLEEVFLPILFLTQLQQPNAEKVSGGKGGFDIIEQIPPIPVDLIIGDPNNPIIKLGKSIITNLKVEVFDYKYLSNQFSNINEITQNTQSGENINQNIQQLIGTKNGSKQRVPTQQRISFDIEPIIPIVQFSENLNEETGPSQEDWEQNL